MKEGNAVFEGLDVGSVPEPYAGLDRPHLDQAGEDVREREEQQGGRVVALEEPGQRAQRRPRLHHEVAVRESASLRVSARAGGVDDRRHRGRCDSVATPVELLVGDPLPGGLQVVERAFVEGPDVTQLRRGRLERLEPGAMLRGLEDDRGRSGVGEEPLELVRRGGLVDGHGDRADVPERVVHERPLVAGPRQQRHAVTGLDPGGDQALGDAAHLLVERERGDVLPLGAGAPAERDALWGRSRRWPRCRR